MKITIVCEGKTEKAFLPYLREFLKSRLSGKMPKLDILPFKGLLPKEGKLRKIVKNLLIGKDAPNHVIALTDVYTGGKPPDFIDANDAKNKMRKWVGKEPRFHPHAAQYEFEAWLLPYWKTIQQLADMKLPAPGNEPEKVNHDKPPAVHIQAIFERGPRKSYNKTRDAGRILKDNDLSLAVEQCPELKAFVNTIISICGGTVIP